MKKVLIVQSSPRKDDSVSRQLTRDLIARLGEKEGLEVVERDLSARPLPHLGTEQLSAFFTPAEKRTEAQKEAARLSEEAVDELLAADIVVISAPMWNFSIPSVLKAWIDHVARAGRTFSYGADGPRGLASGKTVYVVSASGSLFSEGPAVSMDFLEPYLRAVLGFLGMKDVRFVRAEGLGVPGVKEGALEKARRRIEELVAA